MNRSLLLPLITTLCLLFSNCVSEQTPLSPGTIFTCGPLFDQPDINEAPVDIPPSAEFLALTITSGHNGGCPPLTLDTVDISARLPGQHELLLNIDGAITFRGNIESGSATYSLSTTLTEKDPVARVRFFVDTRNMPYGAVFQLSPQRIGVSVLGEQPYSLTSDGLSPLPKGQVFRLIR